MSDGDNASDREAGDEPVGAGTNQKKAMGVPYDWSRPSGARIKSRLYNREDARLFPPKAFGAGWTINFYWLVHFATYISKKRASKD